MLTAEMIQWGVGHGGFHTAEIFEPVGRRRIIRRYVYDCGSKARRGLLYPRIEAYVDGLRASDAQSIDTLYLSHFDTDHVNGLEKLSKELYPDIKLLKIVIPFMEIDEKVMAISAQKGGYFPLYLDLVLDPERTLEALFPDVQVEFLRPSEVPDTEFSESAELDEAPEKGGLIPSSSGNISIKSGSSGLGLPKLLWEVIAYVQPDVPTITARFWEIANNHGLFVSNSLEVEEVKSLIISNYRKLKDISKDVLGHDGSNSSSIVLYSGPGPGVKVKCFVKKENNTIPWTGLPSNAKDWWAFNSEDFGAWLSTGDARLKPSKEVSKLMQGLGKQRLKRVTIISAPHHGSQYNSSAHLWGLFPNATCVTMHAKGGSAIHPHLSVIREVKKLRRKWFIVSDSSSDISISCST